MSSWEWSKDGKSVKIDGQKFKFEPGTQEEQALYTENYTANRWIFSKLHSGETSFDTGEANYLNAVERLGNLRIELSKAMNNLQRSVAGMGRFFTPSGIMASLPDNGRLQAEFIGEVFDRFLALGIARE